MYLVQFDWKFESVNFNFRLKFRTLISELHFFRVINVAKVGQGNDLVVVSINNENYGIRLFTQQQSNWIGAHQCLCAWFVESKGRNRKLYGESHKSVKLPDKCKKIICDMSESLSHNSSPNDWVLCATMVAATAAAAPLIVCCHFRRLQNIVCTRFINPKTIKMK